MESGAAGEVGDRSLQGMREARDFRCVLTAQGVAHRGHQRRTLFAKCFRDLRRDVIRARASQERSFVEKC